MKKYFGVLVLVCCLSSSLGLICFTCKHGTSSMKECSRKGHFEKCLSKNSACATIVRRENKRMTVFKLCKQKQTCMMTMMEQNKAIDGTSTQCNNDRAVSKCSCCCTNKDGCNFGNVMCEKVGKRKRKPFIGRKPKKPKTNQNVPKPVFSPPSCPPLSNFKNGNIKCSDGNRRGSICNFECNSEDYVIIPAENSQLICQRQLKWNMKEPKCEPTCPHLEDEPHGSIECSSDIRAAGSQCVIKCDNSSKYKVLPEGHERLQCLSSTEWDKHQGCCELTCPPHIIADILVLMHASSNKSYERFHQIIDIGYKKLVRSEKDGFLISLVEFSGTLHPQNFFKFKDTMQRNYSTLLQTHMHYNIDNKVNIGRALSWSYQQLRGDASGNRKYVPDFIIVATDSSSTDESVESSAKRWRDDGAFLYVVTQRGRNRSHPSLKEMMKVTANKKRIIRYNGNMEMTAKRLLKAQEKHLCPETCHHLAHKHYEEKLSE